MNKNETIWVEFEGWMGTTSICGYMALDEADDEAPLQFYGVDGLECGSHISQTNNNTIEWEKLSQWFATTDVVQYLVDFAEESKRLLFAHEDDWGRIDTVELYINCSKLNYQADLWSKIDYEDDIYEQFLDSEELDVDELADLEKLANGQMSVQEFADKQGYEWEC